MGSSFYSFTEASNILNRSKRMVHNYVKQGFLRKTLHEGQPVLYRSEVDDLKTQLGGDLPALTRKTLFQLESRIRRLEELMAVVRFRLDMNIEPLHPSPEYARGLHESAKQSLAAGSWVQAEVELWAGLLERFDEETLDILSEALLDKKAWEIFYELLLAQLKATVSNGPEPLRLRLDQLRTKMRNLIVVWVELGRGTSSEDLLDRLDSEKQNVIRRLSTKSKNS